MESDRDGDIVWQEKEMKCIPKEKAEKPKVATEKLFT